MIREKHDANRASRQLGQSHFITDLKALTNNSSQNKTSLLTLVDSCTRYLISDYTAVVIAITTLTDYDIITKEGKCQFIGQNLQDARGKYRLKRREIQIPRFENMTSLYFHVKKYATLKMISKRKINKCFFLSMMLLYHYNIMVLPGNDYLTNVTNKTGRKK